MKKNLNKNISKQNQDPNLIWLCGKHVIFSALLKNRRKIYSILATKNSFPDLEKFLAKNSTLQNLKHLVQIVENEKISKILGDNQVHQGLAIKCSKLPIKNQNQLLEELYNLEEDNLPTLLLLDQLSDPHNIGAIIRSAVSFGVEKIVFCEHNSPKENSIIAKSSAGCIELIDLIVVTNFNNLIEKLKKINYWTIGLAGEGKTLIDQVPDYKNIALIVGSEGDGLRNLVKKNCDILAKIPINDDVESLNASVATSIALYELSRKKTWNIKKLP